MKYKNETHQLIYKTYLIASPYKYPKKSLAAIFLLSADRELWRRAKKAIDKKKIFFDRIDKKGLGTYAFALLHLASDICDGTQYVSLRDLADPYLISDLTYMLIVEAIAICRDGYEYIGINKEQY